jgi:hypothetical protein
MASAAQPRPRQRNALHQDSELSGDFSTVCRVCFRTINRNDQRRHVSQSNGNSCACLYHVECLVLAYQSGRTVCDCGENLTMEQIHVSVPRRIVGQAVAHDQGCAMKNISNYFILNRKLENA